MSSTLDQLTTRFQTALKMAFGQEVSEVNSLIVPTNNPIFGDYQSNVALGLAKTLQQSPGAIAQQILDHLDLSDICDPPTIAKAGFINFTLKKSHLEAQVRLMQADSRLGIPLTPSPQRVVVDFSSPNIAKEMHVGHLRSTIIGDCLARVLEFLGHEVLRLNHVGDWGTQFGMLITYLQEAYPQALTTANALDLGDLVTFYRQAKQRFDTDATFKQASRQAVVKLQAGHPKARRAWELLCEQSRLEFQKIYEQLDISLVERGESFYNPFLPAVITDLEHLGLLAESEGANCVFLDGMTNKNGGLQPLIVQKSDGGYNYATTDLAAIRYRVQEDGAQRIIYVVDVGQSSHFEGVFQVAQRAGWLPNEVEAVHVPFGLVQGEDGKKLKTRSGETVRLQDLLDQAVARSRADLESRLAEEGRTETEAFIAHLAQTVGMAAVKYADLCQNRTSNYIFSYDKMLALQGNTAPYLLYAYVRIQGISRKGELSFKALENKVEVMLQEETEISLGKHLLRLSEVLAEVERDLLPNRLCQYLFELSQKFNQFYDRCPVLSAEDGLRESRLLLCDLTARVLKLGLSLLGIPVVERM